MIKKLQEANNLQPMINTLQDTGDSFRTSIEYLLENIDRIQTQDMAMVSQSMKQVDAIMDNLFAKLSYLDKLN